MVFHQLNIFHVIFILYVKKPRWHNLHPQLMTLMIVCHFKARNRLLDEQTWKERDCTALQEKRVWGPSRTSLPGLWEQTHKNTQRWEVQLQNMLLPQNNTCELQTVYFVAAAQQQKKIVGRRVFRVYNSKWAGTEIQAPTVTGGQPFQDLTILFLPQESTFLLRNMLFFTYSHTLLQW